MNAVDPARLTRDALTRHPVPRPAPERTIVIAAGKAAATMATGLLSARPGAAAVLIAGPTGAGLAGSPSVEWVDAAHPSPDGESERAGRRALALAAQAANEGAVIVLLSGGASSMLAVPAAGVSLADKAATSDALMRAGAPIAALNCVRKHLSAIKGGRLAQAARWRTLTLALSDVHAPIEDDPAVIGSGPTVADPTTFAEALEIVDRYGAAAPAAVRARLVAGVRGDVEETPKPSAEQAAARYLVIGNRRTAMSGAAAAASALGYQTLIVETATAGEAREAGLRFVQAASTGGTPGRPCCIIAAGETVVTVTGDGRGGRNQEFVLGAVPAIEALAAQGISAVLGSAGTDGIDGPTDAAGAIADETTARRAREAGLEIPDALRRHDAYPLLHALGDLVVWGPTGTNVGDLHVLMLTPRTLHAARGT